MKILEGLVEGQVLQRIGARGASASLFGLCSTEGPVFVTVSAKRGALKGWRLRRAGAASRGVFQVSLKDLPAGGPYRLTLQCGHDQVTVKTFFCGDVWLLAGQSNMEGVGDMTAPAKPHPLIRAFSMRREWRQASDPLHVLGESPDSCHAGARQITTEQGEAIRKNVKKGVGVGLFFAREMFTRSGVPQGLIAAAHGGTSMDQWSPALKEQGGDSLYGSMLLSWRATGQPVAGVLWYQGESDTDEAKAGAYSDKMKALVAAVRRDFKQPGLPWLMVQLGAVYGGLAGPGWNIVQEQQRVLPKAIRGLETVASIDLPLDDNIHIGATGFPVLANRLARAADRLVYGNRGEPAMPRLKAIIPPHPTKAPGHIDVVFENVPGGLRSGGEPRGFALVDANGREIPVIFKTTLRGDTARLHFHQGVIWPAGTRLAYGLGRMPVCNISDGRGCALPVFGAVEFLTPNEFLPFCTTWRVSPVVSAPEGSLAGLDCPDPEAHGAETRTYNPDGFINEHDRWQKASGHGYFAAKLSVPEAMKVEFLFGYDGPFRAWIDGKPFYSDIDGINPCVADEFSKAATLSAGDHTLTVAMDVNEGAAWGFFLRLRRLGLSKAEIRRGDFTRPAYSV